MIHMNGALTQQSPLSFRFTHTQDCLHKLYEPSRSTFLVKSLDSFLTPASAAKLTQQDTEEEEEGEAGAEEAGDGEAGKDAEEMTAQDEAEAESEAQEDQRDALSLGGTGPLREVDGHDVVAVEKEDGGVREEEEAVEEEEKQGSVQALVEPASRQPSVGDDHSRPRGASSTPVKPQVRTCGHHHSHIRYQMHLTVIAPCRPVLHPHVASHGRLATCFMF